MRKFKIHWSNSLCRVQFSGQLTMADLNSANQVINGDRRYYSITASIWSFVQADMSKITTDDLYKAIAVDLGAQRILKDHKLALVADRSHSKYLCDYYVTEMQNNLTLWRLKVFSNDADALAWINN